MRPVFLVNKLITRRPGESDFQYQKRLVYGKLVDKTLADVDYTELAEAVYGKPYASDVSRRMFYGSKRTIDAVMKEGLSKSSSDDTTERISELKVERQKLFDERVALNKSIREVARQQELSEIIARAVSCGALPKIDVDRSALPSDIEAERDLLVSLNDIHFGAVVNNAWRKYDSDVCRKMMADYASRVKQIARETGVRNCYVWNAGDSISGNIHKSIQVTNRENVIQQVCGVSELIAEFIADIATCFDSVIYVSVAGNHSRIEANKKDSLVAERLDNIIGWYLNARLHDVPGVHIMNEATVDDTLFMVNIRGKLYVGCHGDFDNGVSGIQNLKAMCGSNDVYAVLSGHLHHNKIDSVGGVKTVMAGSFLGMDDYCVQRRIVGKPEQLVCVCDANGIVCSYDIDLS